MSTTWGKIFDAVKDGFEVVADKAGEYGKLGRIKVEMFQIKRKIGHEFGELGSLTNTAIKEGKAGALGEDAKAKKHVEAIAKLDEELQAKQKEYDETGEEEEAGGTEKE